MEVNYKMSVIIPTIWKSDYIFTLINKLDKMDIIGEIILINNNPNYEHLNIESAKVVEYKFNNIYVNAAWNFGVSVAKFEKICIHNDDALMDDVAYYYAMFLIDSLPSKSIIGICKSCFFHKETKFSLERIYVRNRGYGTIMFMNKTDYVEIPSDLKIWFGDDWLIKNFEFIYRIKGMNVLTKIGTSSESDEFKHIIQLDIENSKKYDLPWSNDY